MGFEPAPPHPLAFQEFGPLLQDRTISVVVGLTLLIQVLIILFHSRLLVRYRGIHLFWASVLLLAIGSWLPVLALKVGPLLPGLFSSILMLWGIALQYSAIARFTESKYSRLALVIYSAFGTALLTFLQVVQHVTPYIAIRELILVPLVLAAAIRLWRTDTTGYRLGAMVTVLPFLGYCGLSFLRVIRGILDSRLMQPGPSLSNDIDTLLYYVCSLLWISGFILMINQRLHSELAAQANLDSLTGCLNRRAMDTRLMEEQTRFQRYSRPYTVIILDLDHFKRVNDTRGHQAGDLVLAGVAGLLKQALRSQDSLARWGGEEFLILLPETSGPQGRDLAERLRLLVASKTFDSQGLVITLSAGLSEAWNGASLDQIITQADQALYKAKETRNTVVLYAPGLTQR